MDILILLLFTLVCAISDLKTRKIPNRLILCGLIWAFLCRIFPEAALQLRCLFGSIITLKGLPPPVPDAAASQMLALCGFLDAALGLLLPCLLLGPLAALRMIGGADVKLLAVIGLQLGSAGSIRVICLSFLYAAVYSVLIVLRRKNLFARFHRLRCYLLQVMSERKPLTYRTGLPDPSGEFCFALPVLAGLSTVIWCAPFF